MREEIKRKFERKHLKRIKIRVRTGAIVNLSVFSSFLVVALIIFRKIILSPGVIGLVNDWFIPPFSGQFKQLFEMNWYAWYPYMDFGQRSGTLSSILLYRMFLYLLASLSLDGGVISKIIVIFVSTLAGFSMFYLCRQMKISLFPAVLSGIFYMMTPMVFDYFVGGIEFIVFIYALMPLIIVFFGKSLEEKNYKNIIITDIAIGLASSLLHIIIIGVALLLFFLLYSLQRKNGHGFLYCLKIFSIILCISFLISTFWMLPLVDDVIKGRMYEWWAAARPLPMEHYLFMEQLAYPINIVRLIGFPAGYFLQTASTSYHWQAVSFIPVFLALLALLLRPKDEKVIFFGILATIGIVLSAGTKGPLDGIWLWLLRETPLRIFRESYKWIPLACMGYAFLLGKVSEAFQHFAFKKLISLSLYKRNLFSSMTHSQFKKRAIASLFTFLIFGSVVFASSWPFLTGDLGGNMRTYNFDQYRESWKWLYNNPKDFRVLMLPAPYPTLYPGQKYESEDIISHFAGKPSIYVGKITAPQFTLFLIKTLYENRTAYLSKLLGLANVKYIVFDTGKISTKTAWWIPQKYFPSALFTNEKIISTLNQQESIKLIKSDGTIIIFNNTDYLPHVFPADQISLIAGDLSSLVSITYMESLKLESLGLIYVNQLSAEDIKILSNLPNVRIIVQDDYFLELVLSAVPKEYILRPIEYAVASSPFEGWCPYADWYWYNWYYTAELDRLVFTFVKSNLTVPYALKQSKDYNVYLKTYFSPRASKITIYDGGLKIGEITTNALNELGFRWVNLDSARLNQGDHVLKIESGEGENIIASIAVVPKDVMEDAFESVNDLVRNKQVIWLSELEKWQVPKNIAWAQRCFDCLRWHVNPNTMKWLKSSMVENDTFILTAHFHGNETVAEEVEMYTDTKPINLRSYPYFELSYKVQAPQVQTVAIDLYVDFTGDYVADEIAYDWSARPLFQVPALSEYTCYQFNMLEEVKQRFPNNEAYNLVGVKIHFKKLNVMADGNYNFFIKHVQVYGLPWTPSELGVIASHGFATVTKHNAPINRSLYIPKQGLYEIYLRGASKIIDSVLTINMSKTEFKALLHPISGGLHWYKVGEITLSEGFHDVFLKTDGGDEVFLDQLLIMQTSDSLRASPITTSLMHERVNPTKYLIHANASQPFYVIFSEAYDDSWKIHLEDDSIRGYPTYSFGNIFFINKTGRINMLLEYERQKLYEVGKCISFSSFIILSSFLIIPSSILKLFSKRIRSRIRHNGK
ncbi:hypothetical protein KEJ17_03570 [Candidatus Bathyarchaeota archaeon]|nr:hypothetical protein [Candidatus Bathyarchaeota archaeon]